MDRMKCTVTSVEANGPCIYVWLSHSKNNIDYLHSYIASATVHLEHELTESIKPGTVLIAQATDRQYYRVRVIRDSYKLAGQYQCFFLDYGRFETLPAERLFKLPIKASLKSMSAQTCCFLLNGVIAKSNNCWPDNLMASIYQRLVDKCFHVELLGTCGPYSVVHLYEEKTGINVADVLVNSGLGRRESAFGNWTSYVTANPKLVSGSKLMVRITEADSAADFSAVVCNDALGAEMKTILSATSLATKNPLSLPVLPHMLCLVKISSQNDSTTFFRAEVLAVDRKIGKARLRLVDLGKKMESSLASLFAMPHQLLKLPFLSIRLCMVGLEYLSEDSLSMPHLEWLRGLAYRGEVTQVTIMHAYKENYYVVDFNEVGIVSSSPLPFRLIPVLGQQPFEVYLCRGPNSNTSPINFAVLKNSLIQHDSFMTAFLSFLTSNTLTPLPTQACHTGVACIAVDRNRFPIRCVILTPVMSQEAHCMLYEIDTGCQSIRPLSEIFVAPSWAFSFPAFCIPIVAFSADGKPVVPQSGGVAVQALHREPVATPAGVVIIRQVESMPIVSRSLPVIDEIIIDDWDTESGSEVGSSVGDVEFIVDVDKCIDDEKADVKDELSSFDVQEKSQSNESEQLSFRKNSVQNASSDDKLADSNTVKQCNNIITGTNYLHSEIVTNSEDEKSSEKKRVESLNLDSWDATTDLAKVGEAKDEKSCLLMDNAELMLLEKGIVVPSNIKDIAGNDEPKVEQQSHSEFEKIDMFKEHCDLRDVNSTSNTGEGNSSIENEMLDICEVIKTTEDNIVESEHDKSTEQTEVYHVVTEKLRTEEGFPKSTEFSNLTVIRFQEKTEIPQTAPPKESEIASSSVPAPDLTTDENNDEASKETHSTEDEIVMSSERVSDLMVEGETDNVQNELHPTEDEIASSSEPVLDLAFGENKGKVVSEIPISEDETVNSPELVPEPTLEGNISNVLIELPPTEQEIVTSSERVPDLMVEGETDNVQNELHPTEDEIVSSSEPVLDLAFGENKGKVVSEIPISEDETVNSPELVPEPTLEGNISNVLIELLPTEQEIVTSSERVPDLMVEGETDNVQNELHPTEDEIASSSEPVLDLAFGENKGKVVSEIPPTVEEIEMLSERVLDTTLKDIDTENNEMVTEFLEAITGNNPENNPEKSGLQDSEHLSGISSQSRLTDMCQTESCTSNHEDEVNIPRVSEKLGYSIERADENKSCEMSKPSNTVDAETVSSGILADDICGSCEVFEQPDDNGKGLRRQFPDIHQDEDKNIADACVGEEFDIYKDLHLEPEYALLVPQGDMSESLALSGVQKVVEACVNENSELILETEVNLLDEEAELVDISIDHDPVLNDPNEDVQPFLDITGECQSDQEDQSNDNLINIPIEDDVSSFGERKVAELTKEEINKDSRDVETTFKAYPNTIELRLGNNECLITCIPDDAIDSKRFWVSPTSDSEVEVLHTFIVSYIQEKQDIISDMNPDMIHSGAPCLALWEGEFQRAEIVNADANASFGEVTLVDSGNTVFCQFDSLKVCPHELVIIPRLAVQCILNTGGPIELLEALECFTLKNINVFSCNRQMGVYFVSLSLPSLSELESAVELIKEGAALSFEITCVEDRGSFYVKGAQHDQLDSQLNEDFESQYFQDAAWIEEAIPNKSLIVVKNDGKWKRAVVLDDQNNKEFCFSDRKVFVQTIDYGTSFLTNASHIRPFIPKQNYLKAPCAVRICLSNENQLTQVFTDNDIGKTVSLQILRLENSSPFREAVALCIDPCYLKEERTAVQDPFLSESDVDLSGSTQSCLITHFESLHCDFFAQVESDIGQAEEIEELLNLLNNSPDGKNNLPFLESPSLHQICASRFPEEDGHLYRCEVISLNPLTVFYVDYGNTEEVSYVLEIPRSEHLLWIPPLAQRCRLLHTSESLLEEPERIEALLDKEEGTRVVLSFVLRNAEEKPFSYLCEVVLPMSNESHLDNCAFYPDIVDGVYCITRLDNEIIWLQSEGADVELITIEDYLLNIDYSTLDKIPTSQWKSGQVCLVAKNMGEENAFRGEISEVAENNSAVSVLQIDYGLEEVYDKESIECGKVSLYLIPPVMAKSLMDVPRFAIPCTLLEGRDSFKRYRLSDYQHISYFVTFARPTEILPLPPFPIKELRPVEDRASTTTPGWRNQLSAATPGRGGLVSADVRSNAFNYISPVVQKAVTKPKEEETKDKPTAMPKSNSTSRDTGFVDNVFDNSCCSPFSPAAPLLKVSKIFSPAFSCEERFRGICVFCYGPKDGENRDICFFHDEKRSSDLNKLYEALSDSNRLPTISCDDINIGSVVAARYVVDGLWYRALVLSKPLNESSGPDLYFIDYGNCEKLESCSAADIRELPVSIFPDRIKPLAIAVRPSREISTPAFQLDEIYNLEVETSNSYMTGIVAASCKMPILVARVVESLVKPKQIEQSKPEEPLRCYTSQQIRAIGRKYASVDNVVVKKILNLEMNQVSFDHFRHDNRLSEMTDNLDNEKVNDKMIMGVKNLTSKVSVRPFKCSVVPSSSSCEIIGKVVWITEDIFFLHLENDDILKNLDIIDESAQELGPKLKPVDDPKTLIGEFCLAKWTEVDGRWYRACVRKLNLSCNEAEVFFIDFGNTDKVPIRDISVIPNEDENSIFTSVASLCVPICKLSFRVSETDVVKIKLEWRPIVAPPYFAKSMEIMSNCL